jgi:hypothetical protein
LQIALCRLLEGRITEKSSKIEFGTKPALILSEGWTKIPARQTDGPRHSGSAKLTLKCFIHFNDRMEGIIHILLAVAVILFVERMILAGIV